jgi:penicillin-binding protein 1A
MVSSDNSVYAQLTKIVGPRHIVETARRLGIRSELPAYFSIGLGAVAVNPLDMTRAYATIANDGKRVDGSIMGDVPRVVQEVRFRKTGKARKNEPTAKTVLSPAEAETITGILTKVVQQGTGRRAQLSGRVAAGKTGTTDNYGDAWFVGYTPELAVAVWVGYPNELRPMETEFNGEPVAGGTLPAMIWKAFMTRALRGEESESFTPAPGQHRDLLRERGVRARRRRSLGRVCSCRPRIGSARPGPDLRAGEAADPTGARRQAEAARGLPLGERERAALGFDRPASGRGS